MPKAKVYSLTLALDDWKPRIWRRLWVRDDIPLPALSTALYQSMGWCGCHMSEFRLDGKTYIDCTEDPMDDWLEWTKYTLRDILTPTSKYLHYTYDFGDGWQLTAKIKLESELDPDAPYPVCVNGKNAPPPENVGGYGGFERFIKIMNNPKHKEYKETAEWFADDTFDPKHFSVDETNDFVQDPEEYEPKYRAYIEKTLKLNSWTTNDHSLKGIDFIGVSAGVMIINDQGQIFLAQRGPKAKNERGCWENPSGAVEFGETLVDAAKLEVREEYSAEIEILKQFPAEDHLIPAEKQHWVATTFLAKLKTGSVPRIMEPEKCLAIGWFSLDNLPSPLSLITQLDLSHHAQEIGDH